MAENSFAQIMKGQPDATLLAVIQDPAHYEPALVEAARAELRRRYAASDEKLLMQGILPGQNLYPSKPLDRLRARGRRLSGALNPFRHEGVQRDLSMIFVSIAYYLFFLIVTGYGDLLDAFTAPSSSLFSKPFLITVLPFIVLPIGLLLFHRRHRAGWLVLTAWIAYSALGLIPMAWQLLHHKEATFLAQPANISTLFVGLLIFGGTFYALARPFIRKALNIPAFWLLLAVGLGAAGVLWLSSDLFAS